MQQQPGTGLYEVIRCIEIVTENGVADALHVKPQLMGSPCNGFQFDMGTISSTNKNIEMRRG